MGEEAFGYHTQDLAAHTFNKFQIPKVGWLIGGISAERWTGKAISANRIYASPILVARALTVDAMYASVSAAAAAGSKARLGLYEDDGNTYPGALIKDFGEVAVDAIAVVSAAADQALSKGIVWAALISDNTPTIAVVYGTNSPVGFEDAAFGHGVSDVYKDQAYGALPSTFPSSGTWAVDYFEVLPRIKSLD